MIYIAIPKGWMFVAGVIEEGHAFKGKQDITCQDHLRDEEGKTIDLQFIIKEALRQKTHKAVCKEMNDKSTHHFPVAIYYKLPPNTDEKFLMYLPERNGKNPSAKAVEWVVGREKQRRYTFSGYGTLWWRAPDSPPLSEPKREKLEEKAKEQSLNRRHWGPSPLPT